MTPLFIQYLAKLMFFSFWEDYTDSLGILKWLRIKVNKTKQ